MVNVDQHVVKSHKNSHTNERQSAPVCNNFSTGSPVFLSRPNFEPRNPPAAGRQAGFAAAGGVSAGQKPSRGA